MRVRSRLAASAVALVGSVVLAVSSAPAAQAVAAFSAKVTLSSSCLRAKSATSSTGVTRGAFDCPAAGTRRIYVFSGNGRTWSRTSTGVNGRVAAFADDGTFSYVMYTPVSPDGRVFLMKRNHTTGARTTITLTSTRQDASSTSGALVVSAGRYWAAWDIINGAGARTYTRQNLVSSMPATFPAVRGANPSLARVGSGVTMLVQGSLLSSGNPIVRYTARTGGTWGTTTMRTLGAFEPQIVRANGVTYMAWTELSSFPEQKVVYQDNASGSIVRRTLVGNAHQGTDVRLFLTGGKPTVVWTGHTVGQPQSATYLRVAQRSGGSWTSLVVGDGASNAWLADAGGWGGRTIVVMGKANGAEGFSTRRQP